MPTLHKAVLLAVLALASAGGAAQTTQSDPVSATVIAGKNSQLVAAVDALRAGNYRRGVELTLEGLKQENPPRDVAAALSNLCAGYAALKEFGLALRRCDESIAIDDHNWRVWNNRAAAHLGLGMHNEALDDVHSGLELAPRSDTLHLTLRIVMDTKRIQRDLQRKATKT